MGEAISTWSCTLPHTIDNVNLTKLSSHPRVCCGVDASVAVGKGVVWTKRSCDGVHIVWAVCCWFISVVLYVPESNLFNICSLYSHALWNPYYIAPLTQSRGIQQHIEPHTTLCLTINGSMRSPLREGSFWHTKKLVIGGVLNM